MWLDEIWIVGAGLTYELMPGRSLDVNANLLILDEAPVDQTSGLPGQRRVAGETTDPYAVAVEIAYHF